MERPALLYSEMHSHHRQRVHGAPASLCVGGLTFDETQLSAMRSVVDELCVENLEWNTSEQREFIAWLVVRLAISGNYNVDGLKNATMSALKRKPLLMS